MKDNKKNTASDFNDLLIAQGEDEVKKQLLSVMINEAANDDSDSRKSPAPSVSVEALGLETLLKRYAFVMPDGKIWDKSKRRVVKDGAFKKLVTEKVYKQWLAHENRLTEEMDDIVEQQAAAQKEGRGGLSDALERYVYLYPTDSVWDRQGLDVVPISSLKYAIADCYSFWLTHPYRQQIDKNKLVFDPGNTLDPETHINMYTGIKMQPKQCSELASPVFMLVNHLCNGDPDTYKFLLDWIAYPLQFPGSKMASAILMHSETHGSGKSLFFEEFVKAIYGEYGATLGQHQLESQYTDWRSRLLFALFEEIFSRDQKYSHTGTIKHMITGKTHRVEKKFVSGWEEANYMNGVFLSNEIQPFPLEPSDRRFLVIWPEKKLPDDLKQEIMHSISNGGVEAFYHELLQRDLSGMTTHTEPPITQAKESLIDFGRATWDVFYREWESDSLEVPFTSCLNDDLFLAYRIWCNKRHESSMGQYKFSSLIASRLRKRRDVRYQVGNLEKKGTIFVIGVKPEETKQSVWLGRCIQEFKFALNAVDPNEMP
tara:strand:- start:4868 stop:6490 length:1623 start_codon:yes stop_codon:yes gene_type:complete